MYRSNCAESASPVHSKISTVNISPITQFMALVKRLPELILDLTREDTYSAKAEWGLCALQLKKGPKISYLSPTDRLTGVVQALH